MFFFSTHSRQSLVWPLVQMKVAQFLAKAILTGPFSVRGESRRQEITESTIILVPSDSSSGHRPALLDSQSLE